VRPREWSLSVFFLAFLLLKVAEAALHLESWPISNVSMFSGLRPARIIPFRFHLEATRGSTPVTLGHADFQLTEDEFTGRLHPDAGLAARCGKLVASYNRRVADPSMRLAGATVTIEPIPRPGLRSDAQRWTVQCAVAEDSARVGQP
jgi:hypothetical protein